MGSKNALGNALMAKLGSKLAGDVYDKIDADEEETMQRMGYSRDS
jgi:hypothetical protein